MSDWTAPSFPRTLETCSMLRSIRAMAWAMASALPTAAAVWVPQAVTVRPPEYMKTPVLKVVRSVPAAVR